MDQLAVRAGPWAINLELFILIWKEQIDIKAQAEPPGHLFHLPLQGFSTLPAQSAPHRAADEHISQNLRGCLS